MGRGSAIILGLIGILLPGYLFYMTYEVLLGTITYIFGQGFFYQIGYLRDTTGSSDTAIEYLTRDWVSPPQGVWNTNIQFYLYIAGFALAVLGLIVILANTKGGSILFLFAGLVNLGLLAIVYSDLEAFFSFPALSGYPIPVGAIFLILAGLIGMRE